MSQVYNYFWNKYMPDFMKSLSSGGFVANKIIENNEESVNTFLKIYASTKKINVVIFSLILFFLSSSLLTSFSSLREERTTLDTFLIQLFSKLSLTMSLILLSFLLIFNFFKLGIINQRYFQYFVYAFFLQIITIILYRFYLKLDDSILDYFSNIDFIIYLTTSTICLLVFLLVFPNLFENIEQIKLCNFRSTTKINISYLIAVVLGLSLSFYFLINDLFGWFLG